MSHYEHCDFSNYYLKTPPGYKGNNPSFGLGLYWNDEREAVGIRALDEECACTTDWFELKDFESAAAVVRVFHFVNVTHCEKIFENSEDIEWGELPESTLPIDKTRRSQKSS